MISWDLLLGGNNKCGGVACDFEIIKGQAKEDDWGSSEVSLIHG